MKPTTKTSLPHEIPVPMQMMDWLWSYDLRRTIACYLSNELHADDKTIQAILNHYDGRALSHYVHKTFDSVTSVIQGYADWLWKLKREDHHH